MRIDLRSDTVTKPTQGMLDSMFSAAVGDDVFGEDPTIIALEQKGATMFGKEAAIFCPSGTMTNQIALRIHTQPGDEVICDRMSHIYNYEGGGMASNSGLSPRLVHGNRGRLAASDIHENINPDNEHFPNTALVSIENTSNKGGGCFYSMETIRTIREACDSHQLPLHLDGARLFNALVASGQTAAGHGPHFDTISICLSKGLGAPVGSLLLGSRQAVKKARRVRKVFGGGMRQAGFMAAAGLYALDNHVERLTEDHQRAEALESIVKSLPYVKEILPVETNILVFTLDDSMPQEAFLQKLSDQGILAVPFGPQQIRFVTHLDFTDDMLNATEQILKQL